MIKIIILLCSKPIRDMLRSATNLVKFLSYDMQIKGQLQFASNVLKSLTVIRSNCVEKVSVWAPKLEEFTWRSCDYGYNERSDEVDTDHMDGVEVLLLDDHPLRDKNKDGELSTGITCSLYHSTVLQSSIDIIEKHPRIGKYTPPTFGGGSYRFSIY
mmetsp:Transcript_11687/g.14572  ORF Transcript_11687/g.14572 Transcript_11687/m.14572 type:complete len:157 (-) Transcript_11687:413-883(-)